MIEKDVSFELSNDDEQLHAVSSDLHVTVIKGDKTLHAKQFHRNGIKKHLDTGITEHKRFLVSVLDGVKVYINGNSIIITKKDLYP